MKYVAQKIYSYDEIHQITQAFSRRALNFVIIQSPPGTGKTDTLRKIILSDCCFYEGALSVHQFFMSHYDNRHKDIVVDDVDEILRNPMGVTLFKSLCNTHSPKWLMYEKTSKALQDAGVPNRYQTTSNVLIFCNSFASIDANLGAVMDRAHRYEFLPTAQEVHREVGKWFDNTEIYSWIGDRLTQIPQPSMRQYVKAKEQKNAGLDWQKFLLNEWSIDPKLAATVEILNDTSLDTKEKRAEKFAELGHGATATYMRYQQQAIESNLAAKPQRVAVHRVRRTSRVKAADCVILSTSADEFHDGGSPDDPASSKPPMPSKEDVLESFAKKDTAMKRMAASFLREKQVAIAKAINLGRTNEFPIHFDVVLTCDGYRYRTQRYTMMFAGYTNGCLDVDIYSPRGSNFIRSRPATIPAHFVHACHLI